MSNFSRRTALDRGALCLILCFVGFAPWAASGDDATFGSPLTLDEPTPLADVLANADALEGERIALRGRIADVCQRRGCWTVLQDGEAQIRVRFQDYGFFLPTDCQGQYAVAEGHVQVRTLSESDARHYESESIFGDPSSIEGPQREVGFVATGVRIEAR